MTDVIKEKNIPEFGLVNEEVYEDTSIWLNYSNRDTKDYKDVKGNIVKFPIKEGIIFDKDGREHQVSKVLGMPNMIFKKVFPDFAKQTAYLRTGTISGIECYLSFRYTANAQLNKLIASVKAMGGKVNEVLFRQTFNKDAKPQEMYKVEIIGRAQANAAAAPQTPVATGQININLPQPTVSNEQILDDREKDLLRQVKALPQKLTSEQFTIVCTENNFALDRVAILWELYK
jgi:hypothetical protein